MGSVKLLYFASAREARGLKEESIDLASLESTTPQALIEHLGNKHPGFKTILETAAMAINEEYIDFEESENETLKLQPGDKVAIIPPISGG